MGGLGWIGKVLEAPGCGMLVAWSMLRGKTVVGGVFVWSSIWGSVLWFELLERLGACVFVGV